MLRLGGDGPRYEKRNAKVSYPVTPNRKNVKGIINGLTLFRYNVRKV